MNSQSGYPLPPCSPGVGPLPAAAEQVGGPYRLQYVPVDRMRSDTGGEPVGHNGR